MVKAVLTWIIVFAISAMLARDSAWRTAFQMAMPFPTYDHEAIYKQIKGRVFSKAWLFSTLLGATLIAGAMLISNEIVMLALLGGGAIIIVTTAFVKAYRLFHIALAELKLPWPPVS